MDVGIEKCRKLVEAVEAFRTRVPAERSVERLFELLAHLRMQDAGDAHDKVYALLGVAGAGNGEVDGSLKPDYRKDIAYLYAEIIHDYVVATQRLDVLEICNGGWNMQIGLPSWTPDLVSKAMCPWLTHEPFSEMRLPARPGSDANPIAVFSPDLKVMIVRVFVIGRLSD